MVISGWVGVFDIAMIWSEVGVGREWGGTLPAAAVGQVDCRVSCPGQGPSRDCSWAAI